MICTLKKVAATAVAVCAVSFAPLAHAGLMTFDIKWSNQTGASVAHAKLTLDSALISTSGFPPAAIGIDQIQGLDVTISGASSGNGHFTKHDFSGISFYMADKLDFRRDLIGQEVTVNHGPWSDEVQYGDAAGQSGGFDLFAAGDIAPTTVAPFAMVTDRSGAESDYLTVSSILARDAVSAVPEPQTYAMLMAGLGLLAWRARRKRG